VLFKVIKFENFVSILLTLVTNNLQCFIDYETNILITKPFINIFSIHYIILLEY